MNLHKKVKRFAESNEPTCLIVTHSHMKTLLWKKSAGSTQTEYEKRIKAVNCWALHEDTILSLSTDVFWIDKLTLAFQRESRLVVLKIPLSISNNDLYPNTAVILELNFRPVVFNFFWRLDAGHCFYLLTNSSLPIGCRCGPNYSNLGRTTMR